MIIRIQSKSVNIEKKVRIKFNSIMGDGKMRTSSAVILMGGLILLVLIGVVVAEDFIMPQDFDEEVSVLSTNNSTNNTTAGTVNVKKHVPPRGIMQRFVVIFWNPWATAPTYNGFVVYKNYVYNRLTNNMWTSVASVDENNQIVNITASDQSIIDKLNESFNITPNATITMTQQPSASITNEENSTNTTETNTTESNSEKISTSINLNDQTLENGTPSTITGTLVDENGTGIADAEVTITINGETTTQTTNSNGQFSYQYTSNSNLDVGEYSMDVSYQGDDTYQESSKSITVTIEASDDENPEENTTVDEDNKANEKQSSNYNTNDNSYKSSSSSSSHKSSSSNSNSYSSKSSYNDYSSEEDYVSSESY